MQKSIHTVSDTLVLTDIAVLMQAREPLLFYYASTTSWEHQQELALSLLPSLCSCLTCVLSHSLLKHVSSKFCFYYHFLLSLPKLQTFHFFHWIFFFFCLWPLIILFYPAKREERLLEKKSPPPPSISAACLRHTEQSIIIHFKNQIR